MITIYLMRHGNTEHNKKSIIMGQIDSPLTKKGLKTASILSKKIKKVDFDQVYSSDLGRAFITAHIIVEELNIEKKLSRAKELREINYGIYANKKKEEVKKLCPEYKKDSSFIFPEGESFLQVQKRAIQFIKSLEKKHENKTVLIITHAGIIRSIESYFKNLDFEKNLNMKITHEYIKKINIDKGELLNIETISF